MPSGNIGFILDEQLRGQLWTAIRKHNLVNDLKLDVIRVGDAPNLPTGCDDPAVLRWAEESGRILVSLDRATMPDHFDAHLSEGHRSPGVLLIRPRATYSEVIEFLVCAAHASEPQEWQNVIQFIP